MINKIVFVTFLSIAAVGCASSEDQDVQQNSLRSNNVIGSIEVVKSLKFQESDGVLKTANTALTPPANRHKAIFHRSDNLNTEYYYLVNKSDKAIQGLMKLREHNLKSHEYDDYKVDFEIGANKKLFFKKLLNKTIKIEVIEARFTELQ